MANSGDSYQMYLATQAEIAARSQALSVWDADASKKLDANSRRDQIICLQDAVARLSRLPHYST
jgi:hypothetical protein